MSSQGVTNVSSPPPGGLGATGLRGSWHIVMPGALPGCLAGLRHGWAFLANFLVLLVGIAVDLPVFGPLERRVLRSRGLLVTR